MRLAASNLEWLGAPNPKWPLPKWWKKSPTTRDKTQPCLPGKSETGCWQRASVTTTLSPASHPLTGRSNSCQIYNCRTPPPPLQNCVWAAFCCPTLHAEVATHSEVQFNLFSELPQQSALHPGLSESVEMKSDQYSVTRSRGAIKQANFLQHV